MDVLVGFGLGGWGSPRPVCWCVCASGGFLHLCVTECHGLWGTEAVGPLVCQQVVNLRTCIRGQWLQIRLCICVCVAVCVVSSLRLPLPQLGCVPGVECAGAWELIEPWHLD